VYITDAQCAVADAVKLSQSTDAEAASEASDAVRWVVYATECSCCC